VLQDKSRKLLGWILALGTGAVTLLVAPFSSFDPVNIPKMSLLAILAFICGSILMLNIASIRKSAARIPILLSGVLILDLIIVLIASPSDKVEQFYGIAGRNTGLLTYFSLSILMVAAILFADRQLISLFTKTALSVGFVLVLYGLIQSSGKDFFPWISAYGNPVIGTFGNPNFQSAFMGMFATVCFGLTLSKDSKFSFRIVYLIIFFLATYVAYKTDALQGIVCLVVGAGSIVFLRSLSQNRKILTLGLLVAGALSLVVILLSLFNVGPLANVLYKASLTARGIYWSAAIEMVKNHPILGVGLDGYGDWFRRSRSDASFEFNGSVVSNSAHNVYLDLAANGGIPLFVLYFVVLLIVLKSIFAVCRRPASCDGKFIALSGCWVAYQAQAFVSINQIGIAIWGWVLSGIIIGYEVNTRKNYSASKVIENKDSRRLSRVWSMQLLSVSALGSLVGSLVGLPPYIAASKYYDSFRTSDVRFIEAAALIHPQDRVRLIQTAKLFESNGFNENAIRLARIATARYPDSTEAWQQVASFKESSMQEKLRAESELKRLDPLNPN
jgi:O-antigen ligase